jgi:hypothetical protein
MMFKIRLLTMIALLGFAGSAFAQEPAEKPSPPPTPQTDSAADSPSAKSDAGDKQPPEPPPPTADPTQSSERLRALLGASLDASGRVVAQESVLPRITKRAFFEVKGKKPEALVEVEGAGLVAVQEGHELSVTSRQGTVFTFRVARLSSSVIELEGIDVAAGRKLILR